MLNPFIPRKSKFVPIKANVPNEIITMEVQDKIKKITDDKTKAEDYVIEKVVVVTSKVNAHDYVQSFKEDVGIENVLKKIALTQDFSLLNQRNRPIGEVDENGYEMLQDYVGVPSDALEAEKIVKEGKNVFAGLPSDLVNNKSFREFVESATPEELQAYVLKQMESQKKEGAE